jgi:fatty acid desaturase
MMHECFHRNGHRRGRVNWMVGTLSSILFGSSYTLIRVQPRGPPPAQSLECRTGGIRPSRRKRGLQDRLYYFAILGGIWIGSFVATLLLPFVPYGKVKKLAVGMLSMDGYNRAFSEFRPRDWIMLRVEALLGVAWWLACIWLFDWDWRILLLAYACFAFSYSSLQWIYHMRTPLDRIEGAYDLRLPMPVRWLFLNFNYNLSHHRHPRAAWQELHGKVNQRETQPLWRRYLGVFKPPERYPDDPSTLAKVYF